MIDTPLLPADDCMDGPPAGPRPDPGPPPPPRLPRPARHQVIMRPRSLDELLPADHDARIVWDLVTSWDLGRFLETVKARGDRPGRPATDPRILIALWL